MYTQNRLPTLVAPSSSGPGRQVLILKIAGSTPAGVTKKTAHRKVGFFLGRSPLGMEAAGFDN